jgi:hypothetical protein
MSKSTAPKPEAAPEITELDKFRKDFQRYTGQQSVTISKREGDGKGGTI